jgi:hypothetical protein
MGWSYTSTSFLCLRGHVMGDLYLIGLINVKAYVISSSLKMETKPVAESLMSAYANKPARRQTPRDCSLKSGNLDRRVFVSLYHLRDICLVPFDQINYGRKDRNLKAAESGDQLCGVGICALGRA